MSGFEVQEPILSPPFEEPPEHWHIVEGEVPRRVAGRRPAVYHYRPPGPTGDAETDGGAGTTIELKLVNLIRQRLRDWREAGRPGVTRTTLELLEYWTREGRLHRLFFAQLEAAETIVFLTEARLDFLQGIAVPLDEPSEERRAEGYAAFRRLACKMATGDRPAPRAGQAGRRPPEPPRRGEPFGDGVAAPRGVDPAALGRQPLAAGSDGRYHEIAELGAMKQHCA